MSRRAFNPTAEQRRWVKTMVAYGAPEAEICLLIKNPQTGEPVDLEAFHKHFAAEIATGAANTSLLVGDRIIASILGRDGGLLDDRERLRLAIFFAKTQMGWKPNAPSLSVIRSMGRMRGGSKIKSPGSREVAFRRV